MIRPVRIGTALVGGPEPALVAGPCALAGLGEGGLPALAGALRTAGATVFRAGVAPPLTPPSGADRALLRALTAVRREGGLPVVAPVADPADVANIALVADALEVAGGSMQDALLLQAVARAGRPVLLVRAPGARVVEWLAAAAAIEAAGNPQVMLVEQGLRSFAEESRLTLDLNCIPYLRQESPYPVLVDPSGGTGLRALVPALARAAVAAGASGVLLDVSPVATAQAIDPERFAALAPVLRAIAGAGRAALQPIVL